MPQQTALNSITHPTDEELLLFAECECSARQAARIREHLVHCYACRSNLVILEGTLAEFVDLHRRDIDSQERLPPEFRTSLQNKLNEAASQPPTPRFTPRTDFIGRQLACACAALLIVIGGAWILRDATKRAFDRGTATSQVNALPRKRLTPGATRPVRLDDVCGAAASQGPTGVDNSLAEAVFAEYGLPASARGSYELDYLITPELGGATDIRNLWPEPYSSTSWNAHVKDELEDHLHEMVCQGKMPLETAQAEIASDWIAAYKRHFHTDTPLSNTASFSSGMAPKKLPNT